MLIRELFTLNEAATGQPHADILALLPEKVKTYFGNKTPKVVSNGYNAGQPQGKKYNSLLADAGFKDLMVDMGGKPVEAWGPKLQLKTKWQMSGRAKRESSPSFKSSYSFYTLKDGPKMVIVTASSLPRAYWLLYV